MDTIKLPFRLFNGSFRTIKDGTDEYYAHLIYCLSSTEAGEIIMRPEVGRGDIIFDDRQIETLAASVAEFIPEVDIDTFEATLEEDGQLSIRLSFERID